MLAAVSLRAFTAGRILLSAASQLSCEMPYRIGSSVCCSRAVSNEIGLMRDGRVSVLCFCFGG